MLTANNKNNGAEFMRLKAEIGALNEQLSQCQADKEFVWSLWKRLQVASPDITQTISLVLQREHDKAEVRNRQVLEVLQSKDGTIDKLQKASNLQATQLAQLSRRTAELEEERDKLLASNYDLQHMQKILQDKLDSDERNSASRLAVRDLDKENLDLKQRLSKLERELQTIKKENKDLQQTTESQKLRSKSLESDHVEVQHNYDHIMSELSDAKKRLRQSEQKQKDATREVIAKNRELELVRKELSDLWATHTQATDHTSQQADLIRQLQTLHKDTRQMLKNQEETFTMENAALQTKLKKLEQTEGNLRQEHVFYEQKIQEQQDMIVALRRQLTTVEQQLPDDDLPVPVPFTHKTASLSDHLSQSTPVSSARSRGRQRQCQVTRRPGDAKTRPTSLGRSPGRSQSPGRSPGRRLDQSPCDDHRGFDMKMLRQRLMSTERKLDNYHQLLRVKDDELKELKVVHDRRLERLRSIVTNYKLVKKQLRIMEEECYGGVAPPSTDLAATSSPKTKKKKLTRCHPRRLQNEDTDHVWNELAFFKNEAKNLAMDKMTLQEQVDTLKVQASQDSASIYELRSCLEQEKEELQFLVEQQQEQQRSQERSQEQQRAVSPDPNDTMQRDMQQEIDKTTLKLKKLAGRVSQLQEDNRKLEKQQAAWLDDRRALKAEVNSLRQTDSDHRMKMADLNREIARLQRELKKTRKKKIVVKANSAIKQYQMKMQSSLQRMREAVGEMETEGWEEVSDTEERTTGGEVTMTSMSDVMTGDSLGQAIVDRAHDSRMDDDSSENPTSGSTPCSPQHARAKAKARQVESIDEHVRRMNRINEPPVKDAPPTPRAEYRRSARSGYTYPSPHPVVSSKVSSKVTTGGASVQQVTSLKQRIKELQQQVKVLKCIKDAHSKTLLEKTDSICQLQAELTAATQKAQSSKATAQRLTAEVERMREEKEEMTGRLDEMTAATTDASMHLQEDWISLTNRLKNAATEVSKQLTQIKQLKTENEAYTEKIKQLNERVNHQERDVAQKRNLVEEMRTKLREVHANTEADAAAMLEVENRMKTLAETNNRYKIQLDAMKQRLATVTEDKYNNEEKVLKLSGELEKKCRQAAELQRKCGEQHATLGAVENTAKQQLQSLAHQSEAAIDMAQSKLLHTSLSLKEFHKFVGLLAHSLLSSIHQARLLQRQHKYKRDRLAPQGDALAPSMKRAKNLASDLLNMSSSDIDDLLSVCDDMDDPAKRDEDVDDDCRVDKEWTKKWQKVIQSKEDFALTMVKLFMQKVDERCQIIMKLGAT